ncbi:MAG TPA: hypothetical protein VEK08_08835 [Planctomycetota bacterium]|nr:hypothetical protein [Planctomycetota bacterium]
MSLVAKVFVVLNLLMSVAFLVFSANVWTAQTKWQKMYEVEKAKNVEFLAKVQKRELGLAQDVVYWQTEVNARKQEIVAIKLKYNEARDRELQSQTELAAVKNARDMKDAENQELQREVRRYAEELTKIKGVVIKQQQAVVVERENAVRARNEKSEMENELNVTKQAYATLQRDKHAIEGDLALQTRRIEKLLANGVPVYQLIGDDPSATQPFVADAQVLAVRPDVGLIMISAGTQQNVKPGFHFTISRGDQYIAKVQVDRVYPDMCSAKVIQGMQKGEIQVHDEARSR